MPLCLIISLKYAWNSICKGIIDQKFIKIKKKHMTTLKQNPFVLSHLMDDLFPAIPAYYPPVNIYENEKGFILELNVPGIKKEDIKYIGEYLKKSEFENKYFLDGFNKDKYDSYIKSNGYVKTILKTY